MRPLRSLLVFKLGFWAGAFASASLLKRAFPREGDAESDDPNAPTLRVTGFSALGGIAIGAKPIES